MCVASTFIDFSDQPLETTITRQYKNVVFSSSPGYRNVATSITRLPDRPQLYAFDGGEGRTTGPTYLDFQVPVNNFSVVGYFWITGPRDASVASANVYVAGQKAGTVDVKLSQGWNGFTSPIVVNLNAFKNVSRVELIPRNGARPIWDNFLFTHVSRQEVVIDSVAPSATGGVDITVSTATKSAKLSAATPIALFWSRGPRFEDRSGAAFFQTVLPKGFSGSQRIHVSANDFARDPRLGFAGSAGNWDTHMLVKVNPAVDDTNVKAMALKRIVLGKDFKATEDGVSVDPTLLEKVRQLASRLIGRNLVTADIMLNEAIRSPQRAHRWSTARLILTTPTSGSAALLGRLQGLAGGTDADGNRWYDAAWEKGLARTKAGALTADSMKALWAKVQANARALVPDRSNPTADAAEGYPPNDALKRYLPNIARNVSNHISGKAIDISIPWRKGAAIASGVVSTGETSDPVASRIVAGFGLKRPVRSERWHFELA